jgi:uncharacterized membrane protein
METIEESIEVNVPIRTAYNQWTQFEEFPRFMGDIESVQQLDDKRLHWVASVAGRRHEWDAEILEQTPDQKISWRSTSGKHNAGTVIFDKVDENTTRVTVTIVFEPEGVIEKMGEAMGIASMRVKDNMKRFKDLVESRGTETGAWRGEIEGGQVQEQSGRMQR